MTVTVDLPPNIEQAYLQQAQAKGIALDDLVCEILIAMQPQAHPAGRVFQNGLGLFGSAEDSALLDEVVAIAYQERHSTENSSCS